MARRLTVFIVLAAAGSLGLAAVRVQSAAPAAHPPTFYKDVLPLLQNYCQECHKPQAPNLVGLVAPMSLMTYADAQANARAIARAAQARDMPPWFPSSKTRGVFANERSLTDAQIMTIVAWQKAGAPEGRVSDAPPPRDFGGHDATGWKLGEPDIAVQGERHLLTDEQQEDMVTFEVGGLPEDVWVQAVEFRAGSDAVHHMCGAAVLPASVPLRAGIDRETSLGCAAPGVEAYTLPDGYAYLLPKNAVIRLDMHYFKKTGANTQVVDLSQVGLTRARKPVKFRVHFNPAGNTTFEVPPRHASWLVGAARTFDTPVTLLALWPHGHSRTATATYWAFYPDGRKELLLDVPKYDHRWQQLYVYRSPKSIPAGTRIEVTYKYDNSEARGAQKAFDANDPVRFGARANDEMMLGYINYAEPVERSLDASDLSKVVAPTPPSANSSTRSHAGHSVDAADLDRLTRATARLRGDTIRVEYPGLSASSRDFTRVDRMAVGDVLTYADGAAIKLRTEVPLQFAEVRIGADNVTPKYAGLYGLWLKKTVAGWRLVFTRQPDVWGTQFDAAAAVADAPLHYERIQDSTDTLNVRLDGTRDGAQLVLHWGPHQWTASFALAPTTN
jgi:hypothetical protein